MKHTIFIVVCCLLLPAVPSVADYPKDEKPVWGLASDTAYNLKSQEFNVSVLGWITYGYSDHLQIGTNFLADIFQIYNFNWKYYLIDESANFPAWSVGAIHYLSLTDPHNTSGSDLALNFSKEMSNEYTLYGGVSRYSTTSLLVNIIRGAQPDRVTGRLGLIINNAETWHSFAEIGVVARSLALKDIAFGLEWASDQLPFRLKLGAYFPTLLFVPIVDISWRF